MNQFKIRQLLTCITLIVISQVTSKSAFAQSCASNEVGGTVFVDFNADGAQGVLEPGIAGVTVSAHGTNNQLLGSTTTNALGEYKLAIAGQSFRLSFADIPSYLNPGKTGKLGS